MSDHDAVQQFEATLDAVDEVLERLRDGTYRTCVTCGAAIPEALLTSDPLRTQCAQHLSGR